MKQLNAKGVRLLVTLCRYVEQHGNVTASATKAARILRAAADDTGALDFVSGIGFTFDGKTSVQKDLEDAFQDLCVDRPAPDPATNGP